MKYLSKIIEYGLYILVFLLPIQTRWIISPGLNEYQTFSLYGVDILLVLLLALFVISRLFSSYSQTAEQEGFLGNEKWGKWLTSGLFLILVFSVLSAGNKSLALYKFSWLILGVGLFWLINSVGYNKLKLIYSFLFGIFLQAILGIWQFLVQNSFSNKWLGLAYHDPAQLGASVVEFIAKDGVGERWLRAYGGFDHPNILGGVLAIALLILISEIIINQVFNYRFLKLINWIFLGTFSVALFFTFSRAAWLAFFVGMLIILAGFTFKHNLKAQKEILSAILISGILIGVLFFQYNELVATRMLDGSRLEQKSKIERITSYQEALSMIKKYPLAGVGLGNYTLALKKIVPNQENFYYQPAHNIFLLVFAESGFLGWLLFMGLILYLAFFIFFRSEKYKDKITKISILAGLVILMFFDHWLWSLHFGILFLWLILSLVSDKKIDKKLLSH